MMVNSPLPFSPDVETIPPDEVNDIDEVIVTLRELLQRDEAACGEKRRDVHVKSHGCPAAEFHVLPGLPSELRQGLFEHEGRYASAVRFSNASPQPKPDAIPDARGIAVKLQGVVGDFVLPRATEPSDQDFVMANHPTFVSRDVKDYLALQKARLEWLRRPHTVMEAFTSQRWNPIRWHWKEAVSAAAVLTRFTLHPASLTYYSMVPIRFGDYIAKYRLTPAVQSGSPVSLLPSLATRSDALRFALAKSLSRAGLTFEFQVQLRTNSQTMPIEDATVEWSERESPYITVAHLLVPRQDLEVTPRAFGNEFSFNVWNALAAHRPLGGINRVRRAAYELSANWRSAK